MNIDLGKCGFCDKKAEVFSTDDSKWVCEDHFIGDPITDTEMMRMTLLFRLMKTRVALSMAEERIKEFEREFKTKVNCDIKSCQMNSTEKAQCGSDSIFITESGDSHTLCLSRRTLRHPVTD